MAYVLMEPVGVGGREGNQIQGYEKSVSLTAIGNSSWILIPKDVHNLSVTLSVSGGGKGKVQTSTDTVSIIKAGSGEVAVDWDYGEVGINTQNACTAVTAIRLTQTAVGATKLTVRAI